MNFDQSSPELNVNAKMDSFNNDDKENEEIKYEYQENLLKQNEILNNEVQKSDEFFQDKDYHNINEGNHDKVVHPKKDINDIINNGEENRDFYNENNNMIINQNEAYIEDYYGQLQYNNIPNQEGNNNPGNKDNLNNIKNAKFHSFSHHNSPHYSPHINQNPIPIGPHMPHFPNPYAIPYGPPLAHVPPLIHGPHFPNKFVIPHGPFPIHGPNPYSIPNNPYFPEMTIPLYPPHNILSPHFPHGMKINQIPPIFPHYGQPFLPHAIGIFPREPIYMPHGFPNFPPHGFFHGPPHSIPHFGPNFVSPQHYDYQNQNENEEDVGFNSNNGQINIQYDIKKSDNENAKDNNYNNSYEYNRKMEFNIDYRPNEFHSYSMNQPNYYDSNQRFGDDFSFQRDNKNQMQIMEESKSLDRKGRFINNKRIPLYVDVILSKALMSENNCIPKIYPKKSIEPFPIIIIHNPEFFEFFLDFLQTNCIYKEYNSFQILKNKLILSIKDLNFEYDINHLTKNMNIFKFADITNSFEYPIYNREEQENIIKTIKADLKSEEKNFVKFMNNWINLIVDLMVEFIKFRLDKICYIYYCNICHFPFIYFSEYIEEEFVIEGNNNNLIIKDSINAFNELIPFMNIPQYNEDNEKIKENIINVICYEEEYNYMNYSFENEINGIFINCNNIKSFNKIMNEINDRNIFIQNKNSKNFSKIKFNITNNYMFELIISAIYIDKIFQYLINNNYFRYIKGICILLDHKNNKNINNNADLLAIKKKYNNYLNELHVEQNDVFLFLKNAKEDIRYRNNKKYVVNNPIINYIEYSLKYLNFHKYISFYYNKNINSTAQIFYNIILDFLKTINIIKNQTPKLSEEKNNKKSIPAKTQKLNNIFKILQIIKQKKSSSNKNQNEIDSIIRNSLEKYENDFSLLISDFNYWLNKSDSNSFEKFGYFIGSLMYAVDTCLYENSNYNKIDNNEKNEEKINENSDMILYKEFIGNYIDVLLHENNKYKLITFPSFLVCSTELKNIPKKDEDKYYIIYIIKYNSKNKEEFMPLLFDLDETTKVFQMFTFFRITDIKIKRNTRKVMIYMEPINKKEYLELKLQLEDTVVYNSDLNIMETIRYDNNTPEENQDGINSNNFYITASNQLNNNYNENEENYDNKITKYMRFFNNKYGTNLNSDMTSLSLEENNMKNLGLLILSKTNLENLIVLNLGKNNISDISPFKNCNFPKLKKLSLESDKLANPQDKITDISPLMHAKFPELFILNLKNNLIRDISYLLFMNFPNLIILDLSYNLIDSVYVFSEVNFPNLETLDLSNNLITDISPFISSNKRKQSLKNVENSNNTLINSSGISEFLSKSISNNESTKKNSILPSLKILKIKNNKLTIDETYLMTIKALKNRDITVYK